MKCTVYQAQFANHDAIKCDGDPAYYICILQNWVDLQGDLIGLQYDWIGLKYEWVGLKYYCIDLQYDWVNLQYDRIGSILLDYILIL